MTWAWQSSASKQRREAKGYDVPKKRPAAREAKGYDVPTKRPAAGRTACSDFRINVINVDQDQHKVG